MARTRLTGKAERVLELLLGLRNRKIAAALASRGFGKDDLEEADAPPRRSWGRRPGSRR